MLSTLYTGATGMEVNIASLAVTGHNIANVNTNGFKASAMQFKDLFAAHVDGHHQVGSGVGVSRVATQWHAGQFQGTDNLFDLSIKGKGLFVVTDGTTDYYTRAGEFRFNKEGHLVTPAGLQVQGARIPNSADSYEPINLGVGSQVTGPPGGPYFPFDESSPRIIEDFFINENGVLTLRVHDQETGQTSDVDAYRLVLADFTEYSELHQKSDNLYTPTHLSGPAEVDFAGNNTRGRIEPFGLEMSNVDMAREFANMISYQRAFQVNSKVVMAGDDVIKTAIGLKR